MLYCKSVPNGDVMVMTPCVAQVVCWVIVAAGVAGAFGGGFIVTGDIVDTQPDTVFFAVTL